MTISDGLLKAGAHQYAHFSEAIKERYADIDDETLRDTLEGISDLPDLIKEVVRSSLEDEVMAAALKGRMAEMQERLDRLKARHERKREIACWAMGTAGIERLMAEDFSVSLRQGLPRLEVFDEAQIPPDFLIPVRPRLDRVTLFARIKNGECVPGAALVDGQPHIAVRVK